jgi:hypothetical protein
MAEESREDRFGLSLEMGKVDPDFMPELTGEDPNFMEKFAAANGIKFVDDTKRPKKPAAD